jgi:hypothetical protein
MFATPTKKETTMLHRGVDISLKVSHAHTRFLFYQKKGIRQQNASKTRDTRKEFNVFKDLHDLFDKS